MKIFRQLRWKLTLSYTLVTVGAFLVVILVMGGVLLPRIFIPINNLNPPDLVKIVRPQLASMWSQVLTQSPVNDLLIETLLSEEMGTITSSNFLRIGSLDFWVNTVTPLEMLVIGPDGTLLGKSSGRLLPDAVVTHSFNARQIQGLEAPYNAALSGEKDSNRLYGINESNDLIILTFPIFHAYDPNQVVGIIVIILKSVPTQEIIPSHILNIAGRSLLFIFLGAGVMGAIFGYVFANGLDTRFKRISDTTDRWRDGDFSKYIEDDTGDEITQFGKRLNNMAKQLQSLLRRRQEMAISEERNRLARDLHDSAKQGALAASFELGTALTLFDSDPESARNHLVEADTLVDGVREELTNLVHELRPQSMDGLDFSETLKEYAMDWSHRNGIELTINIDGNGELSVETRETLFRIAQEALANTARHSAARHANLALQFGTGTVTMTIDDDGQGFATDVQHSGFGLYSMRERAETLGGSYQVASAPGLGTRIVVNLPKGN